MSNRPLQPGDLCLITGTELAGSQCTLVCYLPAGSLVRTNEFIVRTLADGWSVQLQTGVKAGVETKFLMRIDGGSDEKIEQVESDEVAA